MPKPSVQVSWLSLWLHAETRRHHFGLTRAETEERKSPQLASSVHEHPLHVEGAVVPYDRMTSFAVKCIPCSDAVI